MASSGTYLKERCPDRDHIVVRLTKQLLDERFEPIPEFVLLLCGPVFASCVTINQLQVRHP